MITYCYKQIFQDGTSPAANLLSDLEKLNLLREKFEDCYQLPGPLPEELLSKFVRYVIRTTFFTVKTEDGGFQEIRDGVPDKYLEVQLDVEQEVRGISVITCARQKISKGTILPTPSNLPSDADDEDNCANALVTVAMKNPPDDLDPQESNALVPLRGRNYLPFIKNTRVYLRGISTHHLLPYVTASEIHNSISEATLPNPALMSYADNPREANALVYWNKEKTCFEILLLEDVDVEEVLCLRVPKHSAQFHQPESDAIIASDREIEDLGRRVLRLTRKGRDQVRKSTPPPSPAAPAAPAAPPARLEKPPALETRNLMPSCRGGGR